jgi:hypothetical protein
MIECLLFSPLQTAPEHYHNQTTTTMQRYIVQFNKNFQPEAVLAITANNDTAHTVAEALSYSRNGNAIYGLFKIRIMSRQELLDTNSGQFILDLFFRD